MKNVACSSFLDVICTCDEHTHLHFAIGARLNISEVVKVPHQRSCMNLSTNGHHSTSAGLSTSGCPTPAPLTPISKNSNSEDFNITDDILLHSAVQNN